MADEEKPPENTPDTSSTAPDFKAIREETKQSAEPVVEQIKQSEQRSGNGDLLQELQALPERVVNALNESLSSVLKPPAAPAKAETKADDTSTKKTETKTEATPNEPAKAKSFSDWWFK